MPHNFIKISPNTPNPGRRTRADVKAICEKHHGTFEYLWFDEVEAPTRAYVLVEDGDLDGMVHDFEAQEVIRLYDATA